MTFSQFLNLNRDATVNITPEVSYKIRDVIKRDIRLQNSTFKDKYFPDGAEKPFVNIGWIVERTVNDNTDFDTKNFDCFAKNTETVPLVGLLKPALKNYLQYSNYANFLNDSGEQLVRDGHVILKKCSDGNTRPVNLLNVVRPAHIEDFSGGIAEEVHYTWSDMLAHKDNVTRSQWQEIKKLKETYEEQQKDFVVYEWWREGEFEGKQTVFCEKHLFVEGADDANPNALETGGANTIKLDSFETPWFEKIEKKAELKKLKKAGIAQGNKKPIFPYVEKALFRIPGRWKGMGYYELIATLLELYNFTWGQKVRYDELQRQGILIYKRSDDHNETMLTEEWMNQIDTGGIFNIWNDEDVREIGISSKAAEFLTSLDKIFELVRLMSGVTSQRAGGTNEANPNSATEVVRDEKVADTTFEFVKERKGLLYKDLFEKFEIEDMINDLTEEDSVALLGDREELDEIEEPYIRNLIRNSVANNPNVFDRIGMRSDFPQEEEDMLVREVQAVRGRGTRFAEFKNEILKNVRLGFEFYTYGEGLSQSDELKALQEAIVTVASSPTTGLSVDSMIKKKLEMIGIRATDFEKSPQELKRDAMMAQAAQQQAPQPTNPSPV